MTALAVASGVRKGFQGREILGGLDLEVRAGEVLGLIGPNGTGKSTTLLLLAGLIRPDAGRIEVLGVPAHRMAIDHSGAVGLITATPGLYPLLTGWENIEFFGALYGLTAADVRERVTPLAERLKVAHLLDVRVAACSSGMQQKVSLLRAMVMDPPILLLDEPTSNLDPIAAHTIHEAAREHADRGHAVVWVTHDLAAAEQICDRVALIAGSVRHVESFPQPRTVPAESRLLRLWRERVPSEGRPLANSGENMRPSGRGQA